MLKDTTKLSSEVDKNILAISNCLKFIQKALGGHDKPVKKVNILNILKIYNLNPKLQDAMVKANIIRQTISNKGSVVKTKWIAGDPNITMAEKLSDVIHSAGDKIQKINEDNNLKKTMYSEAEDTFIIDNIRNLSIIEIADRLNRSEKAIYNRVAGLKKRGYIPKDLQYKKKPKGFKSDIFDGKKAESLYKEGKRIADSVSKKSTNIRPKKWNIDEVEVAADMLNRGYGFEAIADKLGRSYHSVRVFIRRCKKGYHKKKYGHLFEDNPKVVRLGDNEIRNIGVWSKEEALFIYKAVKEKKDKWFRLNVSKLSRELDRSEESVKEFILAFMSGRHARFFFLDFEREHGNHYPMPEIEKYKQKVGEITYDWKDKETVQKEQSERNSKAFDEAIKTEKEMTQEFTAIPPYVSTSEGEVLFNYTNQNGDLISTPISPCFTNAILHHFKDYKSECIPTKLVEDYLDKVNTFPISNKSNYEADHDADIEDFLGKIEGVLKSNLSGISETLKEVKLATTGNNENLVKIEEKLNKAVDIEDVLDGIKSLIKSNLGSIPETLEDIKLAFTGDYKNLDRMEQKIDKLSTQIKTIQEQELELITQLGKYVSSNNKSLEVLKNLQENSIEKIDKKQRSISLLKGYLFEIKW